MKYFSSYLQFGEMFLSRLHCHCRKTSNNPLNLVDSGGILHVNFQVIDFWIHFSVDHWLSYFYFNSHHLYCSRTLDNCGDDVILCVHGHQLHIYLIRKQKKSLVIYRIEPFPHFLSNLVSKWKFGIFQTLDLPGYAGAHEVVYDVVNKYM